LLNRYYTSHEVAELRLADNKIYGLPAASLTKTSSNLNNAKGFFGETIIGGILDLIAIETPGAYVCHSVGFIDNTSGEIDHVLVYKDRIILVETKAFSGYTSYRVNKEGVVMASYGSGKGRRINDSNIVRKVEYFQEQFPNRKVQAILAIARDEVKTWSENGTYKVASLDNIMKLIRQQMAEAEDIREPAWSAVKSFATMCVKPHHAHNADPSSPVTAAIPVPVVTERVFAPHKPTGYANRPAPLRH